MNPEINTASIVLQSKSLESLITDSDDPRAVTEYFDEISTEMKEATTVVDRNVVRSSADLLVRNLVNACQNDYGAVSRMSDVYKEVIGNGSQVMGVDVMQLDGDKSPASLIQDLHLALSGDLEIPVDLDPRVLTDFIDSLLFANQQLLVDPNNRAAITKQTSLRYYVDNVAMARANLQPKE